MYDEIIGLVACIIQHRGIYFPMHKQRQTLRLNAAISQDISHGARFEKHTNYRLYFENDHIANVIFDHKIIQAYNALNFDSRKYQIV